MRSLLRLSFSVLAITIATGCSGVSTQPTQTGSVSVTEVVPAQGPLAGNVPVQIKGTGFVADNLLVTFGGTQVNDAQVVDAETIRGTLPPRSQPGFVDVVVACAAGQFTLADGFEYHQAASVSITGINPPNGPVGGGTTVTITGTGFSGGTTTVSFGANNGTGVTVASDTELTVLTPAAAAAGAVAVSVSNANGVASLPNAFVYGTGGGGGGGGNTVTENLGGISEFNLVRSGGDPNTASGFALYFAASDMIFPAPGTCALDLNQLPNVTTTLDAGAMVTVAQGVNTLDLAKDTSNGYVQYVTNNAAASKFTLGQMAGISAPGAAAGVAAFNVASVASAPAADYDAWLDPLGFQNIKSGGFWSGSSDLWLMWGEGGQAGVVNTPVNHVQVFVVGQDLGGGLHVLQCDMRDGSDTGAFCVKGGGSGDLCQTPGATMTDFWTAIGGPTTGFGASTVILYRGNRSTYALPNGANAALDVNVVKAGSLIMSN